MAGEIFNRGEYRPQIAPGGTAIFWEQSNHSVLFSRFCSIVLSVETVVHFGGVEIQKIKKGLLVGSG